jgi:hypothetical protein
MDGQGLVEGGEGPTKTLWPHRQIHTTVTPPSASTRPAPLGAARPAAGWAPPPLPPHQACPGPQPAPTGKFTLLWAPPPPPPGLPSSELLGRLLGARGASSAAHAALRPALSRWLIFNAREVGRTPLPLPLRGMRVGASTCLLHIF